MNTSVNLTSGRLLARNTLLNVVGGAAPFFVAIVAIPILIHSIGADAYGVLMLVLLAVGYFGVFAFGLGRAANKFISEAAAMGNYADIPGLFWTSLWMMFGFGLCGAAVLAGLSAWLVGDVLKLSATIRGESLHAFYLMALSLPFVISGGTFEGILSAFQRFDLTNALRVPVVVLYYLAPLAVLPFSHDLGWLAAAIVTVRIGSWAANLLLCLYVMPELRCEMHPRRAMARPLLTFGGWVTVSTVVVPLMEYGDRFLIGSILSVAAVAFYTVPYQVTTKLRVVPGAIASVIFPAFSGSFDANPSRAVVLFERATRYTLLALFPPVLIIVTLAPGALALWVDPSFARHSASAMRWLAIGVFVNSLAFIPDALIEAANRPDIPAKLHSVAAPVYLLLLWWILPRYGVAGAAAAYAVRTTSEMAVFFIMARRLVPSLAGGIARASKVVVMLLLVIGAGMLPMTPFTKGAFLATTVALYGVVCWTALLEPDEKNFVRGYFRGARRIAISVPK